MIKLKTKQNFYKRNKNKIRNESVMFARPKTPERGVSQVQNAWT
jgi:hypothetical protein